MYYYLKSDVAAKSGDVLVKLHHYNAARITYMPIYRLQGAVKKPIPFADLYR